MPIRISSFAKRIEKNGVKLHHAKMDRVHALGADLEPSEAEKALAEERRQLKEERAKRKERALQPGPTALDKLVRTHRPEAKAKATKQVKEPKEAKAAKGGKAGGPKRADKQAAKASALDADRRAKSKSAKT